ncbi:related to oligosaccharide transporter [Cephalotrichum gorgonifer]|uniref:Man(5)GlcNAc(2)-PP-dolichol translocation protein RFT1 n=1 Tax=Cephalotrichum gorgonifer TaxID=2041049 RepID=A0AAE8N6J5_9PEZI|nr:related to oligosaccharide transporter [Cephalotrichum gorgonifer]
MAAQGSALRGASLLITLQLASRLLTFLANQALLRFLDAPLLGFSARLEAYYLTVIFFARESLRVAIQRQPVRRTESESESESKTSSSGTGKGRSAAHDDDAVGEEGQAVVNLAYLSPVLGLLVAFPLAHLMRAAPSSTVSFNAALAHYALAAGLELLSEPFFALTQLRLRFGTRAASEALAAAARCAATLFSAWRAARGGVDVGVLPFAYGQVAYGAVLLVCYGVAGRGIAREEGFSVFPRVMGRYINKGAKGEKAEKQEAAGETYLLGYFYKPTLALAGSMMGQSVVKHFLTQGDTLLVSALSTPHAQGVYALVSNYGGLLARLLFQPVEESSRAHFSRLLASPTPPSAPPSAARDLRRLLRLYLVLSVPIAALAPPFAAPLLALVAGRAWSDDAASALAAYCAYIPLLALNGVLEAFVSSVATPAQVRRQSVYMGGFSAVFAAASYLALRVLPLEPAVGLVVANAVNMLCRIVWSGAFVRAYFAERGVESDVSALVPSGAAVGVCVAGRYFIARGPEILGGLGLGGGAFMEVLAMGAMALPVVALL